MNSESPSATSGPEDGTPLASLAAALSEQLQFKRILATVDFSQASTKGLACALELASRYNSELSLLYVVEFNYVGTEFGAVELSRMSVDLEENATQQLDSWIAALKNPIKTEGIIKTGRAYAEIVETAKEIQADLIVMASHGHTSLAHVLLGSTVERVVRYAPCPVIVVRSQKPAGS